MDKNQFDLLIIGAGAAGLMAALELASSGKKIAILEGRKRAGGRIHTLTDAHFELPVETGAEFIHGNLKETLTLLKKAGIRYTEAGGEAWSRRHGVWKTSADFIDNGTYLNKKYKELGEDISVREFINRYLSDATFDETRKRLESYVSGYYAGDISKASTFALFEEWNNADEEQYRIEGGYGQLIDYLLAECKGKELPVFFSQAVNAINWQPGNVMVSTGATAYTAEKVLITVPVGVLKAGTIRFTPALPSLDAAVDVLGYGPVVKIILQFHTAFWLDQGITGGQDLRRAGFIFSEESIPTWWTQYPQQRAVLTGWAAGHHADELHDLNDEEVLQQAILSLARIFSLSFKVLQSYIKGWQIAAWSKDEWSCGAYSYDVVNSGVAKQVLQNGFENTLFFAGEGLMDGPAIGTVEAALVTGKRAAAKIIKGYT